MNTMATERSLNDAGGDTRWQAVLARDRRADGQFVYAVSSTGVYCRPSCPSRRPGRHVVAFFDAGYGSSSRFYERAAPKLGMSPSTYRRGGAGMSIRYTIVDSPLGRLLVGATPRGVCAVAMGTSDADLERALAQEYPAAAIAADEGSLSRWTTEILAHLAGRRPRLALPLDVQATAFQWQVWEALRAIPYGETRTYGEIAKTIGRPRAVRAVARACATNPVALAIPCHRVVSTGGGASGYRWGANRKKALLARERDR